MAIEGTITVPRIVATSFTTSQTQTDQFNAYEEIDYTLTRVEILQTQEVSAVATFSYPPPPPTPPQQTANRGGSGHYYGPWGQEYIVPLDVSHLLGTHDPAAMFGGDRSERPNATTARGKAIPIGEELSFIKSLPPPKVDTSMSFIKSLGQTTLKDDLKELADLQHQVVTESVEPIEEPKPLEPKLDIPLEELVENLQKASKLLQLSAKSISSGEANPNPETLSRMVNMIKECVTKLESKLPD